MLLGDSIPQKPADYNVSNVDRLAEKNNSRISLENRTPDIVVIMDEFFANLDKLGSELNSNMTVTPFIDSLKENTLRGYTLTSVFGGGTPNSEFEFLTGNSFLFLPTGSIAYQQFIKEPVYSIVQELKSRGYSTIAMHQYSSNSWMRSQIWPLLGFDRCLFLEDFPQKEMLREWGTDQELFEKIRSIYENHKSLSDEPIFMYAVTIQNHGGYDYSGSDFKPSVQLQSYSQQYHDAEQYLSCIHETDKAVQWLIRYFKKADRDVVVLFYGDHYPRLNESFFEEIHKGTFNTLDEQMLQYEVPFFIWTNYETEADEIDLVSMNYLSNLLYQRAGLALPPYNQYLEKLRKTIPACNAYGYYSLSSEGFVPLKEAEKSEKKALLEYNYLEWNNMFDKKNRNNVLFPID